MKASKTAGVKALVDEVIFSLPVKDEHVTLAVFKSIEDSPKWRKQYGILCNELRDWVVNNWIGQWTRDALGAESIKQVAAEGTTLTKTYSTLRF
ncbi:MAG: hypothetical protein F4089_05410 [Gammaproteobacteria bacterium]|nr:hypothetical protein [Gammaproteobacteria bacterium]